MNIKIGFSMSTISSFRDIVNKYDVEAEASTSKQKQAKIV